MTISEQLHFSILSAPIAQTDRRALSQAWYSALYRAERKKSPPKPHEICSRSRPAAPYASAPRASSPWAPGSPSRAGRMGGFEGHGVPGERRTAPLRLARQIEQLVRQRASSRTAATLMLDGTRARVRVLIVASGGSVRLIAICSQRVRATVARALEHARYASAAHGIRLQASLREDVRC